MTDSTDYTGDWGTETGLVDNFIITIEESWFATDARYNNGETLLLNWKGSTDQPIGSDGEYEFTASFPVGAAWVSNDGGKTAESEKGRGKFNASSIYGKIVDSAIKSKAEGGLGLLEVVKERGRPQTAAIWEGLTFKMNNVEFNYGGEIGKKTRLMPVEWLEGAQAKDFREDAAGGAAAGSAAAATPAAAGVAATSKASAVLETKLVILAKKSDTHDAFVSAALDMEGVADDAALLERVVSAEGIYAEARAGA